MVVSLRRLLPFLLLAAVLAAFGCERREAAPPARLRAPRLDLRKEIQELVTTGIPLLVAEDTVGSGAAWTHTVELYDRRHHQPVWIEGGRPGPRASELMDAIERAPEVGLDPRDYQAGSLRQLLEFEGRTDSAAAAFRPRMQARFDVRATYALLRLAGDLRHGRLPGDTLDAEWSRRDEGAFWKAFIDRLGHEDPRPMLAALEPTDSGYVRLKAALARYRAADAAGGWREIPPGAPIGRGARGSRVALLVRRLGATGDLTAAVRDTAMNADLEKAVGEFQTRNGIPRSGVVGEATRAALNVPVRDRIRSLELNLERWRWLPADLGARRVVVNIPAFRVDLVRDGHVERSMRVVVGRTQSPTPVFSAILRYVELNPTWTLPPSVLFKEVIPVLKREPDYFTKNNMIVVPISSGGRRDTLDPAQIAWKKITPDSMPYLVIQGAGPTNPLGRIKLMCPNEYDVYLHDTPQREKFSDAARAYSHGCVRVAGATELADSLLGITTVDTSRVDSLLLSGQWRRLRLPEPIRVHFLYWTAYADSGAPVAFRPDLYGIDARLDSTLKDRSIPFELNRSVSMSPFWIAARAKAAAAASASARAVRR